VGRVSRKKINMGTVVAIALSVGTLMFYMCVVTQFTGEAP
jgi:hypothetical protein